MFVPLPTSPTSPRSSSRGFGNRTTKKEVASGFFPQLRDHAVYMDHRTGKAPKTQTHRGVKKGGDPYAGHEPRRDETRPNMLHRAALTPWKEWPNREKRALTSNSLHKPWVVEAGGDLLPVCGKGVTHIGLRPLHVAVLAGHLDTVREMVQNNPRREFRGFLAAQTTGATPALTALELAALRGRPRVLRYLWGLSCTMIKGRSAVASETKAARAKCEGHAIRGYDAAMAHLRALELDPRVPLRDEAAPRAHCAACAAVLAFLGRDVAVPVPPHTNLRRIDMMEGFGVC